MNEQSQPAGETEIRERLEQRDFHEAFERLLRLYSGRVFHLSLSMLRNQTQAEDAAQEIFLRVWKGLPGYNGAASLSTWIYTIARNTCLTELKKRASRPTVSLDDVGFEGTLDHLPEMQTTDPETGVEMDVHHMLQRLPEKYRRVLTLFYLEQKSYDQVGALLGLPLGTVKTFLYRARKELMATNKRALPAAV
ncbi:MAG TPA: RNA polymerase sigma factor [Verrucomicrobiae bacterium]